MAKTKNAKKQQSSKHTVPKESIAVQSKTPLVFISHDTRDAGIAEAFSVLLSSVSAGVLKSFRSSDKRGTQGIEYGVEWFPEIMKKLDEASDIVCLLTQHSIDRPWILYEAGVAKGKLNNTVLGIALGIPLQKANNGPFAQFQNCADDEEALTKLVMQLARRIPDSEPIEEIIKQQVKVFSIKLEKLLKEQPVIQTQSDEETKAETSVVKLFEEVKIMFQDLPSRIDRRFEFDNHRRRRPKMLPMMLEELSHFGINSDEQQGVGFLIMISIFKSDYPWIYEIGMETYRVFKSAKSKIEKKKAFQNFLRVFEFTFEHPVIREMYGKSDDFRFHKETFHMMRHFIDRNFYIDTSES